MTMRRTAQEVLENTYSSELREEVRRASGDVWRVGATAKYWFFERYIESLAMEVYQHS